MRGPYQLHDLLAPADLRLRNLLPDPLMWSGSMKGEHIGVEHPLKLLLLQDEQMIGTLAPHAAQKALEDGIRARGVIRCCENLDATRPQERVFCHEFGLASGKVCQRPQ